MTITVVREIEKQKTAVILEYQEGGGGKPNKAGFLSSQVGERLVFEAECKE